MARILGELRRAPGHCFWPDSISLLDEPLAELPQLIHSLHVTDTYLFALAVSKGGRLATFDARLAANPVRAAQRPCI